MIVQFIYYASCTLGNCLRSKFFCRQLQEKKIKLLHFIPTKLVDHKKVDTGWRPTVISRFMGQRHELLVDLRFFAPNIWGPYGATLIYFYHEIPEKTLALLRSSIFLFGEHLAYANKIYNQ